MQPNPSDCIYRASGADTALDLPPADTPYVGREAELSRNHQALSGARLVNSTGPGGCGKTRLVLECARHLAAAPAGRR